MLIIMKNKFIMQIYFETDHMYEDLVQILKATFNIGQMPNVRFKPYFIGVCYNVKYASSREISMV